MSNSEVLRSLPQASRSQGSYAKLARLDAKTAWQFLVMPTEIGYDRNVNYSSSNAIGRLPTLQYISTEGWQMSISNLPLSTFWQNKGLSKYVGQLGTLQLPDPVTPPVLAFIWGQRTFSPCVMLRFSKAEKLWFPDGELAECTISFTLAQVDEEQLIN